MALVRRPGPRLADGIVTHRERAPVDVDVALGQHRDYRTALAEAGFDVREVRPCDDSPDAVFVEDALVVAGRLAIVTRPGAPSRRAETAGAEAAARELGLEVAAIGEGTLDGGDVLQVGDTVYVGRSARTDAEGVRQLRALLAPLGRRVVAVPVARTLHLKSAVTTLPDGTLLTYPGLVDTSVLPGVREVPEEAGTSCLPLSPELVLVPASAPSTRAMIEDLGFATVTVDVGEFEKLEGCVTCLSVLVR